MTLLGIGGLPASHPLNLGMMGMHGEAWVNNAIQEADLLIALGMRFDDRVTGNLKTYAPNARKIHVDIDRAEINKNVRVDVGDRQRPARGARRVAAAASSRAIARRGSRASTRSRATRRSATSRSCPTTGICTRRTSSTISGAPRTGEAIVVTDVGQHQMWEAQYYQHNRSRSLITSGGLGTMGFALPAAIGAKIACRTPKSGRSSATAASR